ncbi:MAG TPA: oligopeptide/dipeptide ABC transporter ATP-binding protein [Stellaceae bacterium]|nr:oligopeptide/dipeptide ABC transporter ATP-binding protein [Stellaceae bacterium]
MMPEAGTSEVPPLIDLKSVSRQFGRHPDFAARMAIALKLATPVPMLRAVDQVDLAVRKGEVLGLVGESGCGKSTLGRIAAGILPPSQGSVLWRGQDLAQLPRAARREARLRVQMIFQNPYASLNPRRSAGDIVGEAPRIHKLIAGDPAAFIDEQFRRAGLDPALKRRYPHQFSGGQRQRIGIARALAVRPDFIICDEAVAALDVSVQAQILNLFMDLRASLNLTYLFISHDLGVVQHISDRVAIMYLGRIVEEAPTDEIFARANHPYSQALLAEMPRIETTKRHFTAVKGEVPSPLAPPAGCHFHPRCPHAFARCRVEAPPLKTIAAGHKSACHLNDTAVV